MIFLVGAGKACAARGRTVRSGQVCTGPDRNGHCCAVPVRRGSRRHVTVRCGPARSGAVRGSLERGWRCSSGLGRPFVAALGHTSTVPGGQACIAPNRSGHSRAVPGRGGHCSTAPARSGLPRAVPSCLNVTPRAALDGVPPSSTRSWHLPLVAMCLPWSGRLNRAPTRRQGPCWTVVRRMDGLKGIAHLAGAP